jgi:apolipoprotein N-acyltransferase
MVSRADTGDCARFSKANVLLGLNSLDLVPGGIYQQYNSALFVRQDGKPLGRYDKIHCVPFGEYVPMRTVFPWMQIFSPYKHDYSLECGVAQTRFVLPADNGKSFRFGVLICYEDSVPILARGYARNESAGPPVDFLVNLTNDGWFDGTEEHEQHLALSRFRAIETRRALIRSVNMGISAVIDANGRVVGLPSPTWRESKKVAAAFSANVPIDSRMSIYAVIGDSFSVFCASALGISIIVSWRRRNSNTVGVSS